MTEFTEQPQEVKEVPQETKEVAEARQELDRATLEPAAAVERSTDIKTAEAVEAAVKEAVDAAVPAADRGSEREDLKTGTEGDMDPDPVDGGAAQEKVQVADELQVEVETTRDKSSSGETFSEIAADAATQDGGPETGEAAVPTADESQMTEDGDAPEPSIKPEQERIDIAVSTSGEDFSVEMTGAKPGELRGFETESKTYELKTDGQTGTQTVMDRIENLEAAKEAPPESAEAATLRPVQENASPVEEESAESGEVQRGDEPKETAAPKLGVDSAGEEVSPTAAQAMGGAAPEGDGLPVEDDAQSGQDGSSADDLEQKQEFPQDSMDLAQEVMRDTYLDSQEDLADGVEKISDLNAQKEAVRSYTEDLRVTDVPETSPDRLAEALSSLVHSEGSVLISEAGKDSTVEQGVLLDALLRESETAVPNDWDINDKDGKTGTDTEAGREASSGEFNPIFEQLSRAFGLELDEEIVVDSPETSLNSVPLDDYEGGIVEEISDEFEDPDDLDQGRELPNESPEGEVADLLEDAQEKAAKAEAAELAAAKAEAESQEALKNAEAAQENLEAAKESAEAVYSAMWEELSKEGKYFVNYAISDYLTTEPEQNSDSVQTVSVSDPTTGSAPVPWSIEDESAEAQALYAELLDAIDELKLAAEETVDAYKTAAESKANANALAHQAAQARAEADAAAAAVKEAIAEASGKSSTDRVTRETESHAADYPSEIENIGTVEQSSAKEDINTPQMIDNAPLTEGPERDQTPFNSESSNDLVTEINNTAETLGDTDKTDTVEQISSREDLNIEDGYPIKDETPFKPESDTDPLSEDSDLPETSVVFMREVVNSLSDIGSQIDFESLDEYDGGIVEDVSEEFGDPDDLIQGREFPNESPEGEVEDLLEDAQEKAAIAEEAELAAAKAEAESQEALKNAEAAQENLEAAKESAEDAYAALLEELSKEGRYYVNYAISDYLTPESEQDPDSGQTVSVSDPTTGSAPVPWSIEAESEEAQALYAELLEAIDILKLAAEETVDAYKTASEAKAKANALAHQAAQARAEADAAAAAVTEAVDPTLKDKK